MLSSPRTVQLWGEVRRGPHQESSTETAECTNGASEKEGHCGQAQEPCCRSQPLSFFVGAWLLAFCVHQVCAESNGPSGHGQVPPRAEAQGLAPSSWRASFNMGPFNNAPQRLFEQICALQCHCSLAVLVKCGMSACYANLSCLATGTRRSWVVPSVPVCSSFGSDSQLFLEAAVVGGASLA